MRKKNHISNDSAELNIDFGSKSEYAFDPDRYLERARKGEKLEESAIKIICSKVKQIFAAEPNVPKLNSPITLVGDVHG